MALKVTMPTNVGGDGNYLDKPGRYHCQVSNADEGPVSKKGLPIDGFRFELAVIEGAEKGKQVDLIFYNPKMNATEKAQEWSQKKQGAAIIAVGLATHEQLGQDVSVELSEAEGRQVFVELELSEPNDQGKRFLQLSWANIYHVDDPHAKDFPRDDKAISLLPKHLRRDPASFKIDGNGNSGINGKATSSKSFTPFAGVSDDLGDL